MDVTANPVPLNQAKNAILYSPPKTLKEELALSEHQRRFIKSIFMTTAQINPRSVAIHYDCLAALQNKLNIRVYEGKHHKTNYLAFCSSKPQDIL